MGLEGRSMGVDVQILMVSRTSHCFVSPLGGNDTGVAGEANKEVRR